MESMLNRLKSDIDGKDDKVSMLRKELGEIEEVNRKLSVKLSKILKPPNGFLPTVRAFDSMLRDAYRTYHLGFDYFFLGPGPVNGNGIWDLGS
ncbi:protein gravitropic in the light 1 [Tanacetum coccineum]